jgi:hypothetical protein
MSRLRSHARTRARTLVLLAAALATAGGIAAVPTVASASVPVPVITVTPTSLKLQPMGGDILLHATVKNAVTCKLSSVPAISGLPMTTACKAGTTGVKFTWTVSPPPDSSFKPVHYVIKATATGSGGSAASTSNVEVQSYVWGMSVAPLATTSPLSSVSCSSTSDCVAVGANGSYVLLGATDTRIRKISVDGSGNVTSISCLRESPTLPDRPTCTAVDASGNALSYVGGAWSPPTSLATGGTPVSLTSVSCRLRESPTKATLGRTCAAVDGAGDFWILTYSLGGTIPTITSFSSSLTGPTYAACASSSFCIAVDLNGDGVFYDGTALSSPTQFDASGHVSAATCAADGFCAVTDGRGGIVSLSDETCGNGKSTCVMVRESPTKQSLRAVSCEASLCEALSSNGSVFQAVYANGRIKPRGWDGTIKGRIAGPDHAQSISCVRESPSKASCTAITSGEASGRSKDFKGHVTLLK